jgi:hypothetical protein
MVEKEDTQTRPSWEEITNSLGEPAGDDAKTITRIDARSITSALAEKPAASIGVLEAADYGRIAASLERGDTAATLSEYGLTLKDLPRLQREWSARGASDPAFLRAFGEALAAGRRR